MKRTEPESTQDQACQVEVELGDLVEAVTEALQAGDFEQAQQLLARNPQLAGEVLELLPALRLLNDDQLGELDSERSETGLTLARPLGDFRIMREIGRGGMGVVYEAEQISLNRRVALKILPLANVWVDRSAKRFQHEARAAAQLEHPHIVRVHAVGRERGIHYYAMQYIEGTDVQQVIRDLRLHFQVEPAAAGSQLPAPQRELSTQSTARSASDTNRHSELFGLPEHGSTANQEYLRTFVRIGIQVATALQHAHELGIVHRDIKPSNLLLDSHGDVWVTDFGLAQVQGDPGITVTGNIVGTWRYMSPEQAYAKRVVLDHRTDVYSLGVTLYELLTLKHPFDATDRVELLRQIAFTEPVSPRVHNRQIPVQLETIVLKAMAKNPDRRYQTARELADDLECFRDRKPIKAKPQTLAEHLGTWCQRHWALVAAAATMLVVLFLTAVITAGVSWHAYDVIQVAFQTEADLRRKTERLLKKSEGLRAAAISSLQLENDPGLAFALAVEAVDLHPSHDTHNALLAAYEANHEARTLLGHAAEVGSVAFSPDGRRLISTANRTNFDRVEEPARVWEVSTGELLQQLDAGEVNLTSAVFSPRGVRILATSAPHEARSDGVDGSLPQHFPTLWNSDDGRRLRSLEGGFLLQAHDAVFSPNGERLVTPSRNGTARIWDTVEGIAVSTLEAHGGRVVYAGYSPSGERIATVSEDGVVTIWEANSGRSILRLDHWQTPAGRNPIRGATFDPRETVLATDSQQHGVQLWSLPAGELLNKTPWQGSGPLRPASKPVFSQDGRYLIHQRLARTVVREVDSGQIIHHWDGELLAVSPDGRWAATSHGPQVRIWSVGSGQLQAELRGHRARVAALAFEPAGAALATGSFDATTRIWNRQSGAQRLAFDVKLPRHALARTSQSRDGARLAVSNRPRSWTMVLDATGQVRLEMPGRLWQSGLHAGRLLTTTAEQVRVWDAQSGEQLASFRDERYRIREAHLTSDGNRAIVVSREGLVWRWDLATNRRTQLAGHAGSVYKADVSPDAKYFATGSADHSARIWDAVTGQQVHLLSHPAAVRFVRFAPGGRRLATTTEQNVAYVWDVETGALLSTLTCDGAKFDRVEFSPDAAFVLGFDENENSSVLCWQTETGHLSGQLDGVRGQVRLAHSPTKRQVAIGSSRDGGILWDYESGDRKQLSRQSTVQLAFSPDGEQVIAGALPLLKEPRAVPDADDERFGPAALISGSLSESRLTRKFDVPVGAVNWVDAASNGEYLVSSTYYGVTVIDSHRRRKISEIRGHAAPLSYAGFADPAGTAVVTASWDQTAAIWHTADGSPQHRLSAHDAAITAAAISRDFRSLATAAADGDVVHWNLDGAGPPRPTKLNPHQSRVTSCEFDAGSEQLLTTSSTAVRIHNVNSVTSWVIENEHPREAMFSPDGKQLVVVPDQLRATTRTKQQFSQTRAKPKYVRVYASQPLGAPPVELLHDHSVLSARFGNAPDQLLTITTHQAYLWDLKRPATPRKISFAGLRLTGGVLSPGGKTLLASHRDSVTLWDLDSQAKFWTISGPGAPVWQAEFDPLGAPLIMLGNGTLSKFPTHPSRLREAAPRSLTTDERALFELNGQ